MTRIKKINLWESIVNGIVTDYRRLDNACDAALKAGAMDPSGPLHDAIWRTFSGMLERIDVDDWITWFIYENECGKKAMEAKGCGKRGLTPIKTPRHLARLIVESEEHSRMNVKGVARRKEDSQSEANEGRYPPLPLPSCSFSSSSSEGGS